MGGLQGRTSPTRLELDERLIGFFAYDDLPSFVVDDHLLAITHDILHDHDIYRFLLVLGHIRIDAFSEIFPLNIWDGKTSKAPDPVKSAGV